MEIKGKPAKYWHWYVPSEQLKYSSPNSTNSKNVPNRIVRDLSETEITPFLMITDSKRKVLVF